MQSYKYNQKLPIHVASYMNTQVICTPSLSSLFKYLFFLCLQRLCLLEIKVPKKAKSKPMQLLN